MSFFDEPESEYKAVFCSTCKVNGQACICLVKHMQKESIELTDLCDLAPVIMDCLLQSKGVVKWPMVSLKGK